MVEPPYFTSLFFGWPGGSWSPPTVEEYQYRRRYLPESSIVTVSIMDERQIDIMAAVILAGDHIRVGTEDYPFDRHGRSHRPTSLSLRQSSWRRLWAVLSRPPIRPAS